MLIKLRIYQVWKETVALKGLNEACPSWHALDQQRPGAAPSPNALGRGFPRLAATALVVQGMNLGEDIWDPYVTKLMFLV